MRAGRWKRSEHREDQHRSFGPYMSPRETRRQFLRSALSQRGLPSIPLRSSR
jgi:hypothetical protein